MAQIPRREFLKAGTAALAGATLSALGLGSITGSAEGIAEEKQVFVYTCPVCGEQFPDFDQLRGHFASVHKELKPPKTVILHINNVEYDVFVEDHWTLREALIRAIGLTGNAKQMCDRGGCGSCTVLIDGKPALSCTTLAVECAGKEIETSEGIAADPAYRPLLEAYVRNDTAQCVYCTPAKFTMAKYILNKYHFEPTEEQIRLELSGNICRCGTYARHVKAIMEAAAEMKGGKV